MRRWNSAHKGMPLLRQNERKMVKAVVGANWGDEGKGKITDMLAKEADIVIRFQGGANAGHTIVNDYANLRFIHCRLACSTAILPTLSATVLHWIFQKYLTRSTSW